MGGGRKPGPSKYLSKREQQIMELAHRHERMTAAEFTESLPGQPTNSTVRTLLRILEARGELRHSVEDGRFVYSPVRSRSASARDALLGVARTFFGGSVADTAVALISKDGQKLSKDELDRLEAAIDKARSGR